MNRSAHSLLSVTIRFQFFDEEGVIGQALFQASPGDMLASGDSSLFTDQLNKPFSDPDGVLRYTTCRVESATFTRGRTWRYGQHYSEKLLPVAVEHGHTGSPDSLAPERQGDGPSIGSNATSPSLVAKIGQFWMTNVPANLPNPGSFVHVRVTLNSPSVLDVSPADFRISMTLPNGATKIYSPLSQPAPRVLRGGFLSYTGDAIELGPSVAPDEDFGAIGKMSLKPNVPVSTVLTYQIDQPESADAVHISLVR
jgi:hypothetical protein